MSLKLLGELKKEEWGKLQWFLASHQDDISFPELDDAGSRRELWDILFEHLNYPPAPSTALDLQVLNALRILSRDKTGMSLFITRQRIQQLSLLSGLRRGDQEISDASTEALKCLCNVLYNCETAPSMYYDLNGVESVINALSEPIMDHFMYKSMCARLIFLITALCTESRTAMISHGFKVINRCFEEISVRFNPDESLPDQEERICCLLLKTVFNIFCSDQEFCKLDQKCLMNLLQIFLRANISVNHRVISDVISVLTVVPKDTLLLLIPDTANYAIPEPRDQTMLHITQIVDFLNKQLDEYKENTPSIDSVMPSLLALLQISKASPILRRYLRLMILPHLTDVTHRPEVGSSVRNKLCRLLTSPSTRLKMLSAELLFILCKQSPGRMIKYTGYGNAAGLLAQLGLLNTSSNDYEHDSEDSETEEYKNEKHLIDPITGCKAPIRPNPFDGLSEDEKEHMAISLVNDIDRLQRRGFIQPCQIGPDGKPVPVEHILQLQSTPPNKKNTD